MKYPEEVIAILTRRYRVSFGTWVAGLGEWPMSINLSPPMEKDAKRMPQLVGEWVLAWRSWKMPEQVEWKQVHWRSLGTQSIPIRLVLSDAVSIASLLGQTEHWRRSENFRELFIKRWPVLAPFVGSHIKDLAMSRLEDIERLVAVLEWLLANSQSGLYPRQVAVRGLDTKWLERRTNWITECLALLQGKDPVASDFYSLSGLRRLPRLIRMRVLDPALRESFGGIGELAALPEEIARLKLPIRQAYIVENLQSGLALGDIPGSVAFLALGNSVDSLSGIPWLRAVRTSYWGDIDTYGFAILNQMRMHLPGIASVLMDEKTLLQYRDLWGDEEKQHPAVDLPLLTPSEQDLYTGLRSHRWRSCLRLEQERLPWSYVWTELLRNLPASGTGNGF